MTLRYASLTLLAINLHAAHLVYQTNTAANLVAADSSGNAYLVGNASISKLDPTGKVVWSNSLSLPANAIAVDAAGALLLAGQVYADTLTTTPGVFQPKRSPGICITGDKSAQQYPCPDAFVAKLDPNGNLAWASYLGGLGIDQANGIAVDGSGNVYVTGFTQSADFPSVGAFQPQFGGYADAFVSKISADGTKILYSSFLGGEGYDVAHAVAVDSAGNAYVTGTLGGAFSSLTAGFGTGCAANGSNAFVIKVSPAGDRLVFGGCLGVTVSYSEGTAIAVDSQGFVYVGGDTNSGSFPTTGAFRGTGGSPYVDFVSKIAPNGASLAYSAVFDGGSFGILSLAVDSGGNVYASGPASPSMAIAGPAVQPCPGDNFLLKLNAAGTAPLYSSFNEAPRFALAPGGSTILSGASVVRLSALETPAEPFLAQACVLNSASLASHVAYGQLGVSPGEIVTLKGTGLGPVAPPDPVVANGRLSNILGGTQVFFDGVAAPLLYVQDGQINAVAPYGLSGQTATSIQVKYLGQTTAAVSIPVSATSAAPYEAADSTPLILNADFTLNSKSNPVARGGAVVLYMTGAGQTSPPSVDGEIWQTSASLQASVTAQLTTYGTDGIVKASVPVAYAGPAPGYVSGAQQFNIQLPATLPASFITPQFGPTSVVVVQIGSQQVSFSVYVK